MSLLTVTDLEKSFGAETIFERVNLRVGWGQKVGLVGRNGSGKTTLLRILSGQLEPDKGRITLARGSTFGYLKQEDAVDTSRTVLEEAEDAFRPVLELEARLTELERTLPQIPPGSELDSAMDEYGILHERYEMMGGYTSLRDIRKALAKLGFSEADLSKTNAALSGGEKTRLALAKLLLLSPDILLLDEPTNHLDLDATEWLEEFLAGFGGAVVLVSHDRYFLDKVTGAIAEIENQTLRMWSGNFSHYWKQKQDEIARRRSLYEQQQEEIGRLEEFVRRTMGTQKTGQAKSRLKQIERLRATMARPTRTEDKPMLRAKQAHRSGNDVLTFTKVAKAYGARTLFRDVSLLVRRGDRIGVVGPNGAGKSTLIKLALGRETPTEGSVRVGASVEIGYFAQDTVDLELEDTALDHIYGAFDITPGEARDFLARFLFSGEEVFRKVKLLSGGEKNKLALAQMLLIKPNLLILDEPTNHLDIASCEALAEMLSEFDGTLILVSHDRYLLDRVTTRTIDVTAGNVTAFDGNYAALRAHKSALASRGYHSTPKRHTDTELPPMNAYEFSKARARAHDRVRQAEAAVAQREARLAEIEKALSALTPETDVVTLSHAHSDAQRAITEAVEEWEKAVEHAQSLGVDI